MASYAGDSLAYVPSGPAPLEVLGLSVNDLQIADTIVGRDEQGKHSGGLADDKGHAKYFKLGEGGWALSESFVETIATGDGTVSYAGALSKTPACMNNVSVTAGGQTVSDDGDGNFTGDGTGTINYKTGAVSITFTSIVTLGTDIDATYKYRGRLSAIQTQIGTDDGVVGVGNTGPYGLKLRKTKVAESSASIIDNNGQSVTDDGAGNLTGDGTGTIDYDTGDVQVTFTAAVPELNSIDVSYQYDQAGKAPSEGYTDLESVGNSDLYTFQKDFVTVLEGETPDSSTAYIQHRGAQSAKTLHRVFVDLSEAIDDGNGETPAFFEGGLFSENDVLLAYFTFSVAKKTGSARIAFDIDLVR
jgi:hypothetical protein